MSLTSHRSVRYDVKIAMLIFTILVTSSIAGQNLINVFGHNIATGMLLFPLTFPLVAAATELYGFEYTRSIIWTAAFCNMLMVFMIFLFTIIPSSRAYVGDPVLYHKFCDRLSYLVLISTFAYLISEYVNARIISKLGIWTSGNFLLFRALASISVAIMIDTWLIFPFFISRQKMLSVAIGETFIDMFVKIGYEILLLPLFWLLVEYVRYKEGRYYQEQLPECSSSYSSVHYLQIESGILGT